MGEDQSPPKKTALGARRKLRLEPVALPAEPLQKKQAMVEFARYYEIDFPGSQFLGSGTFATVTSAKCRQSGKFVAVKQLRSCDEQVSDILRSEHHILNSLQHHPNIVKTEGYFDYSKASDPCVFLCVELCTGGSVADYVKTRGPFTNAAARNLFHQLLLGISYIHEKRVVHRDLKPENLLLTDQDAGTLKICDFGSAKKVGEQGSLLLTPNCGTSLYNAPELIFGWYWNERVDIWASGLCLCKILVGKLPFDVSSNAIRRQLQEFTLPRADRLEAIPSLLQNLIKQCLAVDMRDRPPAMELILHPELIEFNNQAQYCSANSSSLQLERHGIPTLRRGYHTPDPSPRLLAGCGFKLKIQDDLEEEETSDHSLTPMASRRDSIDSSEDDSTSSARGLERGWSVGDSMWRLAESKCLRAVVVGDSCATEKLNGVNVSMSKYHSRGLERSRVNLLQCRMNKDRAFAALIARW